MSENTNQDQAKLDEKTTRIFELEHMVMLQGNTIQAFSNRNHELEMRIVELMSQIEYNNATSHSHELPEPVGPHPIPEEP